MEAKLKVKKTPIQAIIKDQLFQYNGDLYIAKVVGKHLILAAQQKKDLFGAKPIAIFRFKHNYEVNLIS